MATTARKLESERVPQWEGFNVSLWQGQINVRDFIQQNYTEYHGDDSFLAPATERTKNIWARLNQLFLEERKKGVLDISQIPSGINAHAPGYIDRDNEVIFGLQTDAPLKRAIMPYGGFRMVLSALQTYKYEPDPHVVETFIKYRKTHNDGVFDAYTSDRPSSPRPAIDSVTHVGSPAKRSSYSGVRRKRTIRSLMTKSSMISCACVSVKAPDFRSRSK